MWFKGWMQPLALVWECPVVFILIISSINIISTIIILMTTTLRWFEDVRVCLRLSFPIRGLPETAGACSELESCSCYDLFAVFVTVFVSVFVTVFVAVFVLSSSLISRSVGCQRAQVLAVNCCYDLGCSLCYCLSFINVMPLSLISRSVLAVNWKVVFLPCSCCYGLYSFKVLVALLDPLTSDFGLLHKIIWV